MCQHETSVRTGELAQDLGPSIIIHRRRRIHNELAALWRHAAPQVEQSIHTHLHVRPPHFGPQLTSKCPPNSTPPTMPSDPIELIPRRAPPNHPTPTPPTPAPSHHIQLTPPETNITDDTWATQCQSLDKRPARIPSSLVHRAALLGMVCQPSHPSATAGAGQNDRPLGTDTCRC